MSDRHIITAGRSATLSHCPAALRGLSTLPQGTSDFNETCALMALSHLKRVLVEPEC